MLSHYFYYYLLICQFLFANVIDGIIQYYLLFIIHFCLVSNYLSCILIINIILILILIIIIVVVVISIIATVVVIITH